MSLFLGVDIGTSSSKGVLVDADGRVLATAVRPHDVDRPFPGHVEMDGELWWDEFVSIATELTDGRQVTAVGVSGMGPCVLLTDGAGRPLRPAILYGVDTRATAQIAALTDTLGGAERIRARCGSALSTQAVGPKLAWIAEHEPAVWARARRLFMPASWLAYRLTGGYVLDHHSASQCTPLFDTHDLSWYAPWADRLAPDLELPRLGWPADIAGTTTRAVAGIPAGTPVVTGTIDAWAEAVSADAQNPGDLMLMYGTTMFLVATTDHPTTAPAMWGTVGAFPGTRNLAGGMATSGAITGWLRELSGSPSYESLLAAAAASGPGARGLLVLPYFAGERTPIMDPDARGVVAGLTLDHTPGDLYRAVLEATALGVRHNVDVLRAAGVEIRRVVAVGGGTRGGLWTQIVSDVTGLAQVVPTVTIGASYGAAYLAAYALTGASITRWNPPSTVVEPDPLVRADHDELYRLYRDLYPATRPVAHALARRQRRRASPAS
ncbi:FGGY-family carbohydrate kinase [Micromonospora cathayae]|uniref:FGGY-family carbohydrate kinase n=1 Tax=Micromonospora cathayae TaxID=3028804 RepID=A0ABY7ZLZ1_9ACTN|nr:FGGY-family carbohydrate kinase [Micromonospora sp. HUAS 3]WDZ83776.1 FGGY-family carbohydrate kinase [Micromonospora sp. HUAS 3]